jgi:hypothetical protein
VRTRVDFGAEIISALLGLKDFCCSALCERRLKKEVCCRNHLCSENLFSRIGSEGLIFRFFVVLFFVFRFFFSRFFCTSMATYGGYRMMRDK